MKPGFLLSLVSLVIVMGCGTLFLEPKHSKAESLKVDKESSDGIRISETGETLFLNNCAACHHPNGLGSENGLPPLAGSPWVEGEESRLIRIVLHGLRGPLEIDDRIYDLEMPGFGRVLTDSDLASILSYIRKRWGKSTPQIAPVTVGWVRAANPDRTIYWTVEELLRNP